MPGVDGSAMSEPSIPVEQNSRGWWIAPTLASVICLVLGGVSIWWQSPTIDEWGHVQLGVKDWFGGSPQKTISTMGTLPLFYWVQSVPGAVYMWARHGSLPGGLEIDFGKDLTIQDQFILLHAIRWTNLVLSGVGTIWVVWWLTRREFGEIAASAASLFAAFEPNLLAAESLGTADAIAVPPTLLALGLYADYRRGGSIWKLLATGVPLGVGVGMKVSMLVQGMLLLGVAALMIRPAGDATEVSLLKKLIRSAFGISIQLASIIVLAVLVSWALNGFYNDALINPTSANDTTRRMATKFGFSEADSQALIDRMRLLQIPAPLAVFRWQFVHSMGGHDMTFLGVSAGRGPWYYYPYIFLMKIHILLLAAALGSLALPKVRRSPIAWSALVLLLLSCTMKLHGGTRYYQLFLALLTPLGGAAIAALLMKIPGRAAKAIVATLLLGGSVGLTANSLPELLTHTSPLWGGDAEGYRYADANYDWGQGFYYAQHVAQRRGLEPIRYIKSGDPFYGIDQPDLILRRPTIDESLTEMEGKYVAVSAYFLYHSGVSKSKLLPLYQALARLGPDGRLTNSFFYFDFRQPSRMAELKSILAEKAQLATPTKSPK